MKIRSAEATALALDHGRASLVPATRKIPLNAVLMHARDGCVVRSGQTPAVEIFEDSEIVLLDVDPASVSLQALSTPERRQESE